MPAKNADQLRLELQAEYLHLQKAIEEFDGRAVTIKAWSVTFSLVALAGAFASHAAPVLLVSCVSALLFWFVEASWKTFQYAHYRRAELIERYFRGETDVDFPFQITASWHAAYISGGAARLARILCWPHVALPHAAVAVIALLLYLFVKP